MAQPAQNSPDDPLEILLLLPDEYHGQFLGDYHAALDAAHRPEEVWALRELLRLWRLRAVAYSSPGYADRLHGALRGDSHDFKPAERLVPGWPTR